MGINVRRIYWITFGIGSACAGVAGSATAPFFPTYPTVGGLFVITAFMVVVLGGMGSVLGAFVGGLIIGVGEKVFELYWGPCIGGATERPPDSEDSLPISVTTRPSEPVL